MLIKREEIRVEDSDSHVDITDLEISKAIMRYINNGNDIPESLMDLLNKIKHRKLKKKVKEKSESGIGGFFDNDDEVFSYIPAEIRLLNKSLEYLHGAQTILKAETPFNSQLHDELYVLYKEFDRKLTHLKKKYRIS